MILQKLTGKELIYTTILGKPNLFTYKFASEVLATQAKNHHGDEAIVDRIYVIGYVFIMQTCSYFDVLNALS